MSKASIERLQRESRAVKAQKQLLTDIALETILDPELHRSVVTRPYCIDAIAHQVLFVLNLAARAKHHALMELAGKPCGTVKLDGSASTPLQTQILLVGLGSVGTRVLELLLASKYFHPTAIAVVTRAKKFPSHLESIGVRCYDDLSKCEKADVVVFCVQPGQFPAAAKSVREAKLLSAPCIAVTVCAGLTADKAAAELRHTTCLAVDIDGQGIGQLAVRWHEEDHTVAQQRRLEFAAQKSVVSRTQGVTENVAVVEDQPASEAARARNRRQRLIGVSFPRDSAAFGHRLAFTLASAFAARGVILPLAVTHAARLVTGADDPKFDERTVSLDGSTTVPAIRVACGMTHDSEVARSMRTQFEAIVDQSP